MLLVAEAWVLEAALEIDMLWLLAELVSEAMADVSDARSEPVAVDRTDESDDSLLLTSLETDDISELTAELMELTTEDTELLSVERDELTVVVVVLSA